MGRRLLPVLALGALVLGLAAGPAAAAASNDPELGSQWGLTDIKAPEAWEKGKGGGISIAVVSTGIAAHPDLTGKTGTGFDATGDDPAADTGGRGTHLAGIAGAATNNGVGIAGVAPDARLVPYKAFESGSSINGSLYIDALVQVQRARPQVVLVDVPDSFPADSRPQLLQALKSLGDSGVSVVVGAQRGVSLDGLPVLAVAATTASGGQASGTAGVGERGVAAPGGDVLSTSVDPPLLGAGEATYGYGRLSGTSQAAAHAAGATAILRGLGANAVQSADFLRSTARKSADASFGAGIIDVAAAATAYRTPAPPPPPSTTPTTAKPAATPGSTVPPTGLGAIPTGPPDSAGLTGPLLPDDETELGEGEDAVIPSGADLFTDTGEEGALGSGSGEGDDRPMGPLAIGFGMLFGVGSGLSVTFRRLADAAV